MDDRALALERIEQSALTDLHAAASPAVRDALGLRLGTVGGALVSIAEKEPSILLNRAVGLGVEASANKAALDGVISSYADAGVGRYFIHLHPQAQPSDLREWLLQAGLKKYRGWMKFHRPPVSPPALSSGLQARPIGREQALDFGAIVASCFDLSDAVVPLLAALVGRPRWHILGSFTGDQVVGVGAMFVDDGVAWLDWGATHPDYRGQGGQGVVLCARIRAAIQLGCGLLATATGEAVAGDPQHSYNNILRTGFEPLCLRENYVPGARG